MEGNPIDKFKGRTNNHPEQKQYDFSRGCILKANQDMPFLGVEKGDVMPVVLEDGILIVGPLSWSPEQLTQEINEGIWTVDM